MTWDLRMIDCSGNICIYTFNDKKADLTLTVNSHNARIDGKDMFHIDESDGMEEGWDYKRHVNCLEQSRDTFISDEDYERKCPEMNPESLQYKVSDFTRRLEVVIPDIRASLVTTECKDTKGKPTCYMVKDKLAAGLKTFIDYKIIDQNNDGTPDRLLFDYNGVTVVVNTARKADGSIDSFRRRIANLFRQP